MRYLLLVFLMCLFNSVVFASYSQEEEQIIYNGERHIMDTTPLESYFYEHPRPQELSLHEIIVERFDSSCNRGYVGYWKIEDDFLYLEQLLYCGYKSEEKIPLSLIFKEQKPPIKALWYTGELELLEGKALLPYVYERYIIITIKNGIVISERTVEDKDKFKTRSVIDLVRAGKFVCYSKENWEWIDARLIRTVELGKQFVTRGGLFSKRGRKPPVLLIPCTPTTPREKIPIQHLPDDFVEIGNAFVEIGAHLEKNNGDYSLYVDWIRKLGPQETIHHPSFKAPPNVKPVYPCIEEAQKEMNN